MEPLGLQTGPVALQGVDLGDADGVGLLDVAVGQHRVEEGAVLGGRDQISLELRGREEPDERGHRVRAGARQRSAIDHREVPERQDRGKACHQCVHLAGELEIDRGVRVLLEVPLHEAVSWRGLRDQTDRPGIIPVCIGSALPALDPHRAEPRGQDHRGELVLAGRLPAQDRAT